MDRIEAALIDAGGVLTLLDTDLARSAFAKIGIDVDPETLDRAHYAAVSRYDRSDGTEEDQRDAFCGAYAAAIGAPKERMIEAVTDLDAAMEVGGKPWSKVRNGAVDGLRAICEAGVNVAIVSNAAGKVEEELQALAVCQVGPGPGAPVVAVIDSAVVGVAKPDPQIFQLALEAVGAVAKQAIHVGDSIRMDVKGARAAGIQPLHFDPYGLCAGNDHEHVASLHEVAQLIERSDSRGSRPRRSTGSSAGRWA